MEKGGVTLSNAAGKIVFIANTAWSMYNFRRGLLSALISKGVTVYVLAPFDAYAARLESIGVQYKPLKHLAARGFNPVTDMRLLLEIRRLLRSIRPDLVFTYTVKPNIYGVIAAASSRFPVIAVITGLGYGLAQPGLLSTIVRMLYAVSLKRAEAVWFLNAEDLSYFCKNRSLNRERAELIPGEGVDVGYFNRTVPFPTGLPVRFLYAGRLLYDKGVGEFVEAVERLRREGLPVAGALLGFTDVANPSAVSRETVDRWEVDGRIEYWGETDDVRPFLQRASCLVFPSYYSEGIPRCLLEAGSMAIPAITTDHVGCRDVVVDGETGYLVAPRDVTSLAEKMRAFVALSDEEKLRMGEKARERVTSLFSEKQILAIYCREIARFVRSGTIGDPA